MVDGAADTGLFGQVHRCDRVGAADIFELDVQGLFHGFNFASHEPNEGSQKGVSLNLYLTRVKRLVKVF